jgi:hypothetical protein
VRLTATDDLCISTIIFGTIISPLTTSANSHIFGVSAIAPKKAAMHWHITNIFKFWLPTRNCEHLSPYNPHPFIVAIAKQIMIPDKGMTTHLP